MSTTSKIRLAWTPRVAPKAGTTCCKCQKPVRAGVKVFLHPHQPGPVCGACKGA